jgi:hypothetical protein
MNSRIDQLGQLAKGHVWDGNLISKHDRDELVKAGLAARLGGWNFLTDKGIEYAVNLHLLAA